MFDPVPSSAIYDATTGGLSVIVITGGSDGDVLTRQADGTYAPETPSAGGSPGGSSGQVQWNSAGAFAGATAVVYAATVVHVAITSQGATIVPFCVKGAASQSANLQEWQNSSGTVRASVGSTGNMAAILFTSDYVNYSTPAYRIGDSSMGFGADSTVLYGRASSTTVWACSTGFFRVGASQVICFASTGSAQNAADVGYARNAAGVLEVNSGTAGTLRDLMFRDIIMVPSASRTLATNGQFSIEMTSNTAGNLVYRGSDGTTRRMALTFS